MARNPQAIIAELESVVAIAEGIIAAGSEDAGLLDSLRARCVAAKEKLAGYYATARDKVTAGAESVDETIRDNPYRSLAVALGVGVVIGLLITHRNHDHE